MIRVLLAGATGRTGSVVAAGLAAAEDVDLVARVAPSLARSSEPGSFGTLGEALQAVGCDVAVDFTLPHVLDDHLPRYLAARTPLVLGTTGLAEDARAALDAAAREAGVPVFYAPNFALGAVVMMRLAVEAARFLPRAEIVELHSEHKRDRPSGTAAVTAERMREAGAGEVPIHSVRLPGLVAHQEVIFGETGQVLTIRHDTLGREAFTPGVLLGIRRVQGLPPGLTVGLEALLSDG